MTYKELKLNDWLELRKVLQDPGDNDLETQSRILAAIYHKTQDQILDLPIPKYQELAASITFLLEPIPTSKHIPDRIKLGETTYKICKDQKKLSAGQYIDYQTLAAMEDPDAYLPNILACFLVPVDKTYGDYDTMEEAENIAANIDVSTALSICRFFQQASLSSIKRTLIYLEVLTKRLKRKTKNNPEIQEQMEKLIPMMKEYRNLLDSAGSGFTQSQ